jgi:hypothetical protein
LPRLAGPLPPGRRRLPRSGRLGCRQIRSGRRPVAGCTAAIAELAGHWNSRVFERLRSRRRAREVVGRGNSPRYVVACVPPDLCWRPIQKMPGTSLSASKRVVVPDRQVSWLRIVAAGLLPKAAASVDLVHGSPVTVTGSRRIRTGFPFQLSSSHLSASLLVEALAGITSPKRFPHYRRAPGVACSR